MSASSDYRTRIYQSYAKNIQDAGEDFDRIAAERWGSAYQHYLRAWMPEENARIVDLACGGGRLLHFFKLRGYRNLSGVDLSPDQIELSRQVIDAVYHQDVSHFLDSHADSFDLITGLDIIEHFHKNEAIDFLEACHRALKPGGRIILQTPNGDSPFGAALRYGDFTHEIGFTANSLSRLMAMTGFRNLEPREMGPVMRGRGIVSCLRGLLWTGIRQGIKFYNAVETGNTGSGIFTRAFLISGTKPVRP